MLYHLYMSGFEIKVKQYRPDCRCFKWNSL